MNKLTVVVSPVEGFLDPEKIFGFERLHYSDERYDIIQEAAEAGRCAWHLDRDYLYRYIVLWKYNVAILYNDGTLKQSFTFSENLIKNNMKYVFLSKRLASGWYVPTFKSILDGINAVQEITVAISNHSQKIPGEYKELKTSNDYEKIREIFQEMRRAVQIEITKKDLKDLEESLLS